MRKYTAAEIAKAVSGELVQGSPETVFDCVSTDTRQIKDGDLFIALIGEKFDAHDFADQAVDSKAGGLVVSKRVDIDAWNGPIILVRDTLQAFQDLARFNRQNFAGLVVGVTGSNGKTTTKDLIASVLEQKFTTLKTQGNFNNEIGLPLTLLQLDDNYQAAVLEMGMRGLGEIDLLASIALPDGAVIINIGETHVERLGSVANIAKAKGEILDYIDEKGFAVLNGDDIMVRQQSGRCKGRIEFYGTGGAVRILAKNIKAKDGRGVGFWINTRLGEAEISLSIPGRHNVLNALAAVGVGIEAGLTLEEIKKGLESVKLISMRLEIIEGKGLTIINDSYNANPASVKAALHILGDIGVNRRKVAVLGEMYELGQRTVDGHREVGEEAAAGKVDILVTVGRLAEDIALGAIMTDNPPSEVVSVTTNAEAKKYLAKLIQSGDVVLVKGSRGMKMEEIVQGLQELEK
jgi:UDP-N-acetylmuramoyl-tripeptide--D-alanyl-D-alanine ligase